jgi:hypothetical protein
MLCVLPLAFCLTSWAASEKVLHAFHGTDGCGPNSLMVGPDGALYGTTVAAGTSTCSAEDIDSGAPPALLQARSEWEAQSATTRSA